MVERMRVILKNGIGTVGIVLGGLYEAPWRLTWAHSYVSRSESATYISGTHQRDATEHPAYLLEFVGGIESSLSIYRRCQENDRWREVDIESIGLG